MKDLYQCESCGFLSTFRPEFKLQNGIFFCKECIEKYEKKEEPEYLWVYEKIYNQENSKSKI